MRTMKRGKHNAVRNFVLLGHTGSGKTQLVDAILHRVGLNTRLGTPDDGSSMADWTEEEKERKISIWAKPFTVDFAYDESIARLVFVDTPGYADFFGQVVAAAGVADAALIAVDAVGGLQVGTTRAWKLCEHRSIPRGVVITGIDRENADPRGVLEKLRDIWGRRCIPVVYPTSGGITEILPGGSKDDGTAQFQEQLMEAVAETDDTLIEKYLGGEELSAEEVAAGARRAVLECKLVPVWFASGKSEQGVEQLLRGVCRFFPAPGDRPPQDQSGEAVDGSAEGPLMGLVWRAVNDPYVGQMLFVRIFGGILESDSEVYNSTKKQKERIGSVYVVNGRHQETVGAAAAGEIVALAKLRYTTLNDTLTSPGCDRTLPPIVFPQPVASYAVAPKSQGDEDKLSTGLQRLAEDDPTLKVERNPETKELILSGLGDVQIDVAVKRLKQRSNVDVGLTTPRVPYKETITAVGEGHYKHKKQTGGRGQYGEVYLRVEPREPSDEEWFVDAIVGGVIPSGFMPAIQKGLVEAMQAGALAGYPVINVKVTVYDGSHHEVDSSEISFKIAAARAFRDGMSKARPVLLEPIMKVKVMIPDQFMGEVAGDLNQRRGRILGMSTEDGLQVIHAEVPQAEMFTYASQLRSLTGGRGTFEMQFSRYEVVPSNIAQKIIAVSQKERQAE